ncbi:MAG: NAD(P)/FAD-dependent oxidoreductase, partial [Solirubrobacteraceae bacterium]|nr:NAD(P)/FAD-dependent oxidoreductase [Solirubrobacteraceae bacterium]
MHDVIVIGGGHNGLVCAILLAREGRRVLVLEQAPRPGGAVFSDEVTVPGAVHDLFSTNQNTFRGGPVWARIGADLERLGLRYAHTDAPYSNVFPGGRSLKVYGDPQRTLAGLREHAVADADGWAELHGLFGRYAPTIFKGLGTPLPSWQAAGWAAGALKELGPSGALRLAQLLLASTRDLGDAYLSTPEARALMACWGLHLDFGPDVSGGAMIPFVESFADMEAGMSIVEGGASRLIDALCALLAEHGGEVRTGVDVARIRVEGGRARGVELASGEPIDAAEAIVASVTPTALYGRLLSDAPVPEAVRRAAGRFTYGPGTMMLHLALSDRVPWEAGEELQRFAYVHIGPYVEDLADTYTAARNGLLPRDPMLVVGQTSTVDPTRAPEGTHVLWVQVRALPAQIRGDAAGEIAERSWAAAGEPYAERVMAKLERYAPGLGGLVRARAVLTPADLERRNPNLVGGDCISGSHHLRQNFLWRPLPGLSRYATPFDGLFMTGASTWPGGGVTGIPGMLAAEQVLRGCPPRRRVARRAAAA